MYWTNTSDCFCKGIESTQLHGPEDTIPEFYDKCEPGYSMLSKSTDPKYKISIEDVLFCVQVKSMKLIEICSYKMQVVLSIYCFSCGQPVVN